MEVIAYVDKGELLHKITKKKCGKLNQQEYDLVGLYVQSFVENLILLVHIWCASFVIILAVGLKDRIYGGY